MVTSHDDYREFSIRGLTALARRINDDPSLVETDWREAFHDHFELTRSQRIALSDISDERNGEVQAAFAAASQRVRQGERIRLRVHADVETGRRMLMLQVAGPDGRLAMDGGEIGAILCCCADCSCWHWCWEANPCLPPVTVPAQPE
ncbi:hypothetical protein [Cellulomonas shaoxiangyii]|uniref:Uncharacterized protein n=1 Tax=Cellulomonas shaoxiangyii TaxID=2566013 RepID=A0A4P7SLC4_9CELL|nr:hypothetical protein [Cellulomonas shaoxiangyii]QCB95022.1 hypothetical protein E5225_17095 [Cellulomonas shaoxiangyii]TGY86351.1 hypothetical protein E5226_02180 [Cellulomonas shaoxiangyii]